MGKALYRKYRSKSLDEVIGQEHITDTLKTALEKGAISHAYLFTGPRGVGKTSIARILAYAINNLPYSEEATHLDIIEIDAASNRRIDEIRELRDKIHIAPLSAKYKVYIIDEVHMLTREAFNALLKTLEEPPEHVVFILATTEAHKVPDTIVSRTQRFQFKPISREKVINHLKNLAEKEGIHISHEALELIAEHGGGSFRDSISMLDQVTGHSKNVNVDDVMLLLGIPDTKLIKELVDSIKLANNKQLFDVLQKMREQGTDAGQLAKAVSAYLRQELIDGTTTLDATTTISLLEHLLPLTAGSSDYYQLEVILLKHIADKRVQENFKPSLHALTAKKSVSIQPTSTTASAKEPPIEKPDNFKQTAKKENPTSLKSDETNSTPDQTIPTGEVSGDWNNLLGEIKKNNNTLYGLLRMSEPEIKEGTITIYFQFPFHKKQIDSAKHQTVLKAAITKYYGDMQVITAVRKKTAEESIQKPILQPPTPIDMSPLASITNIFGGAELLES